MVERSGLLWDDSSICTRPLWEHEPKIEDIIEVFLRLGFADKRNQLHVSVLGQGAINKAYLVQIRKDGNKRVLVMRVSLPIDPGNKIRGEVTTLQWLRRYTTLPVPEVIDYMASPDDDIGYEWLMMSHVPGQTALVKWRKMSMDQKRRLVEQVARYQHELTARTFDAIGTLRKVEDRYAPGKIVDMEFCFGDHFSYNINRGPFHCARDWFQALSDIIVMDFQQVLDEEDLDEFDLIMTKHYLELYFGTDLSLSNMIVSEDGNINGIIDWECVSTIPIWAATGTPSFLRSQDRHDKPRPERYYRRAPTVDIYGRDDEGLDIKYWRDLEDYEFTVLRAHYDTCRRHHNPRWKNDLTKDEKLKYDFLDGINLCRAQDFGGAVDDWIDALEEGNIIALEYSD
ncbi:uncharacterized protein FIESC28_10589 [Fusarium coffeatum]|uniref:Aminoglycoside phosphotransferase domain-containing protein n=1 Tax=Fusarium coffeatum TaxID=231269 RepID=A0A366QTB9_9HYPO|nr:uncharacterized protein FIESC28_10589 [Fusarium coffeatum]RBR07508.1 hypothetical protein FIESC28_10589 [Fusarium coffeatum]